MRSVPQQGAPREGWKKILSPPVFETRKREVLDRRGKAFPSPVISEIFIGGR